MNELLQPLQPESFEPKILTEFLEKRIPYENFSLFPPSILAKYANKPLPWQDWAKQISEAIYFAIQSGSHMFPVEPDEIMTSLRQRRSSFCLSNSSTT
jgi:hypothetical protein